MRALTVALLLAASGALAAPSNKTCLVCHTAPLFEVEAFTRSVHAGLQCADCHKGYDFSVHRAKPPAVSKDAAARIAKLATRSSDGAALEACGGCHESQRDDLLASVHGRWISEERPAGGPTCLDCHGAIHAIPKVAATLDRKKAYAARCGACHEDEAFVARAGIKARPEFADSIHGRLIRLGNERAPVCFNCHGAHDIAPLSSPASMVVGNNKTAMCAECHKGAAANFAATFTHEPANKVTRKVPYYTAKFFALVASLVLTGLVVHLSFDAGSEFRLRWRRRKGLLKDEPHVPKGYVQRFDRHQLMQHWLMIVSTFTLLFSGWPLRAASIGTSSALVRIFGGAHGASIAHRAAGIVLGFVAVYHAVYLIVAFFRGEKFHSMLPNWKDVRDFLGNCAFFVGLRKERPKFGHYMYIEKFEYLALSWGTMVIFFTGLVRWFPAWFAKWMPAKIIELCQIAHGYEAMMAALVLLVWHLYNVHLKATVFPMSWVWIDGRIDLEALKEEHAAEYEELEKQGKLPRGDQ